MSEYMDSFRLNTVYMSILQYMCNSNYLTKVIVFIKYYVVARSLRKLDVLRKTIFYNN